MNNPKFTHDYPKTHIAHARRMRKSPTDAERKLWGLLKSESFRWRRQQPVGKYIVDFYYTAKKVIVEVDGGQHCGSRLDQERDAWLSEQGYQVLRFWNNDVQRNLEGVVSVIREITAPLSLASQKTLASTAPPRGAKKRAWGEHKIL